MCALQVMSTFLGSLSTSISSLGLLSSAQAANPDRAVVKRDLEPPEYMKEFEKSTKDFMEQQAKSRSIERYDPPKSNTRKKRSLGTETQNNIPRNKKRISKKDFANMVREKRSEAVDCRPPDDKRRVSFSFSNETIDIQNFRWNDDGELCIGSFGIQNRSYAYENCQISSHQRGIGGQCLPKSDSTDNWNYWETTWTWLENNVTATSSSHPSRLFEDNDNITNIVQTKNIPEDPCTCIGYTRKTQHALNSPLALKHLCIHQDQ